MQGEKSFRQFIADVENKMNPKQDKGKKRPRYWDRVQRPEQQKSAFN
ncbi:hypothetical protein [Virgibacillus pantothenticus]|nr:hypothetical protein [Virgibacillus pantothenticus]MED3737130.1 hypothetical protein [Virgibacillus pantothenticus]QTY15041.1 hypothetical protein KBP50_14100 [Virgibacillus pantothenticus]